MPNTDTNLQDLLEAMPDAVLGVGIEGRITLVNQRVEQVFGFRRDELLGQQIELVIPEPLREVHAQHLAGCIAKPRARAMGSLELKGRRENGPEFPAEISLRSSHSEGEALVLAAVRDVTDRVRDTEERERLRHAAERHDLAQRLNQAERLESFGLLAGGVALLLQRVELALAGALDPDG